MCVCLFHAASSGCEVEAGREATFGGEPEGYVGKGLPGEEQAMDAFTTLTKC